MGKTKAIKLVLDTNTFVSAFFWEGNEAELLKRIERSQSSDINFFMNSLPFMVPKPPLWQ